jgi:2-polyprenyl-3-methyl-5-hydroxy-6-metoxy-1,4-benzoquinol methylase
MTNTQPEYSSSPDVFCRICHSPMQKIDTLNINGSNEYVLEYTLNKEFPIDVFFCQDCYHGQLASTISATHYNKYENLNLEFVGNTLMKNERKRQLDLLLSNATNKKLLIDIGCGTGVFLENARSHFAHIMGIEPSIKACQILKEKNIPYINNYFARDLLQDQLCDAFYCSQVVEHLENPLSTLKDIYAVCEKNAVGIIEVPNGQEILEHSLFSYLFNEHINYFSISSLTRLASKAGFLIEYCNSYDKKNIEILLRKQHNTDISFSKRQQNIIKLVQRLPKNKRISAWGGGVSAGNLMTITEQYVSIRNWYDINPGLHGKYYAGCQTVISRPTVSEIQDDDIILLFNSKYDKEIISDLRSKKFDFSGEIIIIQ